MIGDPPDVASFREHFDWPDAVICLPCGSSAVADLLSDLDRQPELLAQIRRDNLEDALRRHDWLYRWRSLLAGVSIEPLAALQAREALLEERSAGL